MGKQKPVPMNAGLFAPDDNFARFNKTRLDNQRRRSAFMAKLKGKRVDLTREYHEKVKLSPEQREPLEAALIAKIKAHFEALCSEYDMPSENWNELSRPSDNHGHDPLHAAWGVVAAIEVSIAIVHLRGFGRLRFAQPESKK